MRKNSTRWLAAGLGLLMAATMTGPVSSAPSTVPGVPHEPQQETPVSLRQVPVKPLTADAAADAAIRLSPAVAWPKAGAARVSSAKASVEILDRAAAVKAGVKGVVMRVHPAEGGPVQLTVDYGAFRHAYGANWGDRLRVVRLKDSAPVPSTNNRKTGTVTADVETGLDYALMAGPSGGTGTFAATPLALSSSWQVSGQTGEFSWSYPFRMPETPGNLTPQVALSYSSSAVDGRTASTNNQPSWAGEGFDLWSGYIERSYKGCADDLAAGQTKTGDQCWFSDNATMSLAGHSGPLVRDDATALWRLKNDDGSRIERLFGAANGDNDSEYWKVTSRDGVQYFFGSKPETMSTWTAPVFGNHAGEPCHGSTFDTSWCSQAYRWNLDYVVDSRDNSVTYHYTKFGNSYGLNMGRQTVAYDRGGVLARADYGTRRGSEGTGTAPARVVFTTADRCLPNANCALHNPQSYPDVPFDQECSANCTTQVSPTFWTAKRLSSITTYAGSTPVETWTLNHSYPSPGDGTSAGLWLSSINHSGLVGGTEAMPPVTFSGLAMPNRVNSAADGLPPLNKWRVVAVNNEYGGVVGVNYAAADCVATALPAPDTNTQRCFPVYWQPEGGQPLTDWMHKYVVGSLTQVDRVGGMPTQVTSYDYLGGGAWHYADNELVNPERRTWSEWRGYQRLIIRQGNPGGMQSAIEYRYFRGMNGDRLANGGTRSVSIADTQGGQVADEDHFNGQVREKITYNGFGGPVLSSTVTDLWQRGPTSTHGSLKAFMVDTATVRDRSALSGGAWRGTRISRSYDTDGLVTQIDDLGDLAVNGDEECTRTWYVGSRPSRVQAVGVSCAATPTFPGDAISDVLTFYDAAGNPTRVDQLSEYQNGQPVYVTSTKTTYDGYGRPVDSFDALNRKTTTTYTDSGGLTTKMTFTNPLGHATSTELSVAWGEPLTAIDSNGKRTDIRYDPLGRVIGVWLPGRSEGAGEGPNLRYRYRIRNDSPSSVSTDTLRANGNYLTSHALYDGFVRARQTQSPAWGGGRMVTDTVYDERGLLAKTNGNYYAEGAPEATLVAAGDNNIPTQTVNVYDGAGRATASIFHSFGVEKWRSTTAYGGDRIDRTPPPGGTATSTIVDASGKTMALHQYHGVTPTGPADITRYTYTKAGLPATVTDPAGNRWRYGYDLRARRISFHDPDKGDLTATYDAAGQALSTTDSRGKTLSFKYDALGRKTEEREGSTLRAKWTYDTLQLGMPTSSTRIEGGNAYTTAVVGYDSAGRPTGTKVTIPGVEGGLAGSYQTDVTYRPDGSPSSVAMPRAGDLAPETVTYTYDDLGLAKATTGTSAYVNDTWYTRFTELAQLSMGGAGSRIWQTLYYDVDSRRLARSLVERERTTGSMVNDFRYTYDSTGNVTRIADVPVGGPTDIQCFAYDYLRRMTEAWTSAGVCTPGSMGGASPYWTSYRYDLIGNRTSETQRGPATATRTYSYTNHALTSVTGSTVDTYAYDTTGNTTSRTIGGATQTLTWDVSGRLVSSLAADLKTTTFGYDADGNRLLRRDPTATTLYLGGQQIRLDRTTGVATGTRFYAHAGSVVAVRTGGGLFWQAGDHHGTGTTSISADTLTVSRRQFTPFGDTRGSATGSWPDERGFVGGTKDDSLGLVQLGAREYDAKTGRFLSVDPIIDADDPQQLNGYAYANNNPASMSDPDGLKYFVDVDGLVTIPDLAHATPQQIDKAQKKAERITRGNEEIKKRRDDAIRSTGHTPKEVEEARELKKKTVLDVVIEAGGEVLKEFLGINDIKGCFQEGDLGSCISMVVNAVPWFKILKVGALIGAVKKCFSAIRSFKDRLKNANKVLKETDDAIDDANRKGSTASRQGTEAETQDGVPKPREDREANQKNVADSLKNTKVKVQHEVLVPVREGVPGMSGANSGTATVEGTLALALAVGVVALKRVFRKGS